MKDSTPRPPLTSITFLLASVATTLVSVCLCGSARADGKPPTEREPDHITTRQYNDRLPPVMPGEEIVTETGQKMRVWSSSGPVPINRQPTPQPLPNGAGGAYGGVGVIVDGRDQFGHQPQLPAGGNPGLGGGNQGPIGGGGR